MKKILTVASSLGTIAAIATPLIIKVEETKKTDSVTPTKNSNQVEIMKFQNDTYEDFVPSLGFDSSNGYYLKNIAQNNFRIKLNNFTPNRNLKVGDTITLLTADGKVLRTITIDVLPDVTYIPEFKGSTPVESSFIKTSKEVRSGPGGQITTYTFESLLPTVKIPAAFSKVYIINEVRGVISEKDNTLQDSTFGMRNFFWAYAYDWMKNKVDMEKTMSQDGFIEQIGISGIPSGDFNSLNLQLANAKIQVIRNGSIVSETSIPTLNKELASGQSWFSSFAHSMSSIVSTILNIGPAILAGAMSEIYSFEMEGLHGLVDGELFKKNFDLIFGTDGTQRNFLQEMVHIIGNVGPWSPTGFITSKITSLFLPEMLESISSPIMSFIMKNIGKISTSELLKLDFRTIINIGNNNPADHNIEEVDAINFIKNHPELQLASGDENDILKIARTILSFQNFKIADLQTYGSLTQDEKNAFEIMNLYSAMPQIEIRNLFSQISSSQTNLMSHSNEMIAYKLPQKIEVHKGDVVKLIGDFTTKVGDNAAFTNYFSGSMDNFVTYMTIDYISQKPVIIK